jgi:hypothetical protein
MVSAEEIRALAAMLAQQPQQHQLKQQQQQEHFQQQQYQQQNQYQYQQQPNQQKLGGNYGRNLGGELVLETEVEHSIGFGQEAPRPHNVPELDEIEEEANNYFRKIYTSEISIANGIQLLQQFKSSTNVREQQIFRCMIHNFFDEYRFFNKYPDQELYVTGCLFGALIQHQLISSITLGIALRYVLEALRKDPEHTDSNEKMFHFGKISLDQFRPRLGEWPQYCSHLLQIPHLARYCPDLYQDAQRAINSTSPQEH